MTRSRLLGISLSLVLLGIIAELLYIFVLYPRLFPPSHPGIQPQSLKSQPTNRETLDNRPAGYTTQATDQSSFLLVAQLDEITLEKNGDVKAEISLQLDNTEKPTAKTILLYSHTAPSGGFTLIEQRTPDLYPVSADTKSISLDLKKNPHELIQLVDISKRPKIILSFLTPKSTNAPAQQVSSKDPQYLFVTSIRKCNSNFYNYMQSNGTTLLTCTPYAVQMGIIKTNI